jgi:hypothetical protein
VKFYGSFGMQFAKNLQATCFFMKMPNPIQSEQPRREFKNYSGNFLNIRFTARTWRLVTSVWFAKNNVGGKYFADGEEVETKVRKWLSRQSRNFYAAGFKAVVR